MTSLLEQYRAVRETSHRLCEPLSPEDMTVQAIADTSPTKWHLAHTTWFFETFLLAPHLPGYQRFHEDFNVLFNSYYNSIGEQFPRPRRGLLTRPSVQAVFEYRSSVDAAMERLLEQPGEDLNELVTIGLHHEQQHQELLLTDIKYLFSQNPTFPVYMSQSSTAETSSVSSHTLRSLDEWCERNGRITAIGVSDSDAFHFDNEAPRHEVSIRPHALRRRLTTNGEYSEFVESGGYQTPELWLSDGWATVKSQQWNAPLNWVSRDGEWHEFTLRGLEKLNPAAPVCHVSFYEADAFARWSDARLPTEYEWESAARQTPITGNFLESDCWHPRPETGSPEPDATSTIPDQMFGDVWEWTCSPYLGYPGYRPAEGALGEYNGKFMCNQFVLRGGSCATSLPHIRASYRNFFPPDARWQFMGIRLARDIE